MAQFSTNISRIETKLAEAKAAESRLDSVWKAAAQLQRAESAVCKWLNHECN